MSDTAAVTFEITGLERCHRGAARAVFSVVLWVDGIELGTHGWTLEDRRDTHAVNAPRHRNASGLWVPSLDLPPDLLRAVADEVLKGLGLAVT